MTQQVFHYGECPECQFDVVVKQIPPKLATCCPLCAGDNGRDVYMRFRPATDADKPEGFDARAALTEQS